MMNKKSRETMKSIITEAKKNHFEKYYINNATIALLDDCPVDVYYQSKKIGTIKIINNDLIFSKRFDDKVKLCKTYKNKNNYNLINSILINFSDNGLCFIPDSSM